MDLGLGQPMEHVLRSWLIAARLGDHIGVEPDQRGALYYVVTLAGSAASRTHQKWRPGSVTTSPTGGTASGSTRPACQCSDSCSATSALADRRRTACDSPPTWSSREVRRSSAACWLTA